MSGISICPSCQEKPGGMVSIKELSRVSIKRSVLNGIIAGLPGEVKHLQQKVGILLPLFQFYGTDFSPFVPLFRS